MLRKPRKFYVNRSRRTKAKPVVKALQGRDYHSRSCLRALLSPGKGPTPFPDRMRVTLCYSSSYIALINNSAAKSVQQFSMNSMFKPDFTNSGAQPEYFDQLSALYNRYRVYGSAIKVTCLPFNTSGAQVNVPTNVVLVPTAQTLASLNVDDAAALPRAQNRVITGNMDYKNVTMVGSHSVSEILGAKDVEGADRLQALINASPSEQALWAIVARTADGITAASLGISVRLSYDVEFFDRQVQLQSLEERKSTSEMLAQVSDSKVPRVSPAEYKEDQYIYVPDLEEAHYPLLSRLKSRPRIQITNPPGVPSSTKDAPPQTPGKKGA